ncbi:MAG: flagellin [Pirellulales bacterium]
MPRITPVPTTRVSDVLVQSRLLTQMQFDQQELFRIQTQVSTGQRFFLPSENAPAALRAITLQTLIERKDQVYVNLQTNQSFLSATDAALSEVSQLINDIRGAASSVVGVTSSDAQRQSVVNEIDEALRQLVNTGNQNFRGRYLFAGSRTTTEPFEQGTDFVAYHGNEDVLRSFSDLDVLFETSVHGSAVFGAISDPVRGSSDLNPVVTANTLLADVNGGQGVRKGSISISDGTNVSIVDLSSAVTLGDVIRQIEAHPPAGREITATLTQQGLQLEIDPAGGGNFSVTEVGGGRTAADLGILETNGTLTAPILGDDLNPRLKATTSLDHILGSRATARLVSAGANNDLVLTAATNGPQFNGAAIQLVDDSLLQAAGGLTAGNETVEFDAAARSARASVAWPGALNDMLLSAVTPGTDFNDVAIEVANQAGGAGLVNGAGASYDAASKTLTITLDNTDGAITAGAIRDAIEADGNFTVAFDNSLESGNDGSGTIDGATVTTGEIGNTGNSGGAAGTLYIHVQSGVSTAAQVAEAINEEGTFTAQIDPHDAITAAQAGLGAVDVTATASAAGGSGIAVDRSSGIRIENGGATYVIDFDEAESIQDVVNTLNASGAGVLAQINENGTGINIRSRLSGSDFSIGENGGTTAAELGIRSFTESTKLADLNHGFGVTDEPGADFIIERNDGTQLEIDLAGATTIADVLERINGHSDNQDPATAVTARLATFGNGIELVDDNPGGGASLTVHRAAGRIAAEQLGFIPAGQATSSAPAAVAPTGVAVLAGSNNDLQITANQAGTEYGGTRLVFVADPGSGDAASVNFSSPPNTLTVEIDPGVTRAVTVRDAISAHGLFTATLESEGSGNDGTGTISETGEVPGAALTSGQPQILTGSDVNPVESKGVFTGLLRLRQALVDNNTGEIGRAMELLDGGLETVQFARSEIGARQQGLDALQARLEDEKIELQSSLSKEIDVDLTEAISQMTARQIAFQASLQTAAGMLRLTLLDFL